MNKEKKMLAELVRVALFAGNGVAAVLVGVFCLELRNYKQLMNKRQKFVNTLTIPAMVLFTLGWSVNAPQIRFGIACLTWIGCIIDLFHLCKEETGWKLTNLLEFVLLSFLVSGCGAILLSL